MFNLSEHIEKFVSNLTDEHRWDKFYKALFEIERLAATALAKDDYAAAEYILKNTQEAISLNFDHLTKASVQNLFENMIQKRFTAKELNGAINGKQYYAVLTNAIHEKLRQSFKELTHYSGIYGSAPNVDNLHDFYSNQAFATEEKVIAALKAKHHVNENKGSLLNFDFICEHYMPNDTVVLIEAALGNEAIKPFLDVIKKPEYFEQVLYGMRSSLHKIKVEMRRDISPVSARLSRINTKFNQPMRHEKIDAAINTPNEQYSKFDDLNQYITPSARDKIHLIAQATSVNDIFKIAFPSSGAAKKPSPEYNENVSEAVRVKDALHEKVSLFRVINACVNATERLLENENYKQQVMQNAEAAHHFLKAIPSKFFVDYPLLALNTPNLSDVIIKSYELGDNDTHLKLGPEILLSVLSRHPDVRLLPYMLKKETLLPLSRHYNNGAEMNDMASDVLAQLWLNYPDYEIPKSLFTASAFEQLLQVVPNGKDLQSLYQRKITDMLSNKITEAAHVAELEQPDMGFLTGARL